MRGYSDFLRDFLRPLGIYDLSPGSLSNSELEALGSGFDGVSQRMDYVERESALSTAEGEGLLRIGGDCFTLTDINNTISGCGIKAVAQEKEQFGYIRIVFPEVAGIPEGFEQIRDIILDIIPCHLDVEFYFRYLTWAECEAFGYTWAIIHEREYTWHGFELAV